MSSVQSTTRPVLSRPERIRRTRSCLEGAASASKAKRLTLIEEVVLLNLPVARSIAGRYRHRGISDDDLEQVAYLALVRAAQQFDTGKDSDFLSYAVPTVRGELKKLFRDSGWTIRPPRRVQELQQRIGVAQERLGQDLGRSPRPSELAMFLEEDLQDVIEALATRGCYTPDSLDRATLTDEGTPGSTVGDLMADPSAQQDLDASEARVVLAPLVRQLSDRDRRILDMRFFHGATQQEIADDIGVTQMHVSRLLSRIFAELREQIV